MVKKIPVKTFYLLLVISIGLIGLGIGSTYAIFTTSTELKGTISLSSNLSYDADIVETVEVVVPAKQTVTTTLNVTNSSDSSLNYIAWYLDEGYNINVGIGADSGTPTGSLASGGTTSIVIDIRNNSSDSVTVSLGVLSSSSSVVLGSGMTIVPNEVLPDLGTNLITYITNLYKDNYDSTQDAEFADATGINYYAPNVRLMNDGLDSTGGMTNDPYTGNIRYYGADDTTVSDDLKNYIYFNCSDYSDTSTCERWRIIGIIDGKVKIISSTSIGAFAWDYTSDAKYNNNWSDATLMTLLNSTYYAKGTTTYYNGSTTGTEVDMSSVGITDATKEKNLISYSTWYLGGYSTSEGLYANDIYTYERTDAEGTTRYSGNPFTKDNNIGLIYASDYGYASDLRLCEYDLRYYSSDSTNCTGTNWLLKSVFGGVTQWLITPRSSTSTHAWIMYSAGRLYANYSVYNDYTVHPVLYLDPELSILDESDGSYDNPFVLVVN